MLNDLTIVITRPTLQAKSLCDAVVAEGGNAIHIPAIDIVPLNDDAALEKGLPALKYADYVCFVSVNAVWHSLPVIKDVLVQLNCIAVGPSTARMLQEHGFNNLLHPELDYSSEGILDLKELQQLDGKNIVLFRGEGGRNVLANTLRDRGATVREIAVYRRMKPEIDVTWLSTVWQESQIDLVVSTSPEGLCNLCLMMPKTVLSQFHSTPIMVISPRMAPVAKKLGFIHTPIVAENATDQAVMRALQTWAKEKKVG